MSQLWDHDTFRITQEKGARDVKSKKTSIKNVFCAMDEQVTFERSRWKPISSSSWSGERWVIMFSSSENNFFGVGPEA